MKMKTFVTAVVLAMFCGISYARAQLRLEPAAEAPCLFGGRRQTVSAVWSNAGTSLHKSLIRTRMTQLSSATAMPIAEATWKTLQVLPAQTVLETAEIDFPAVRGETRFLIQWLEGSTKVVGATEVRVYPTNMLAELNPLLGGGVLGIFDPQNELKPLLTSAKVAFVDLENSVLEDFRGQLAIIGPFESGVAASPPPAQVKTLSEKGVAVVWIQSHSPD